MLYDTLIRDSIAPVRVRGAIDRLLATGAPVPILDAESLRRFVSVVEVSRFAVEILRTYDEGWEIITGEKHVSAKPSEELSPEAHLRMEIALSQLEVVLADVGGIVPFAETLTMLSDIAVHALERSVELARAELEPRYGADRPGAGPGFVVLGLGKLGGRELNFSSDIDLIFVFDRDGESVGGSRGKLSLVEWYTRLAERVVVLLSSRQISPFGYRVDMRLRPEGKTGPLVRSLDSTVRYYEREGSVWERQALLKARPVAGDIALGQEFLSRVEPFIYRRYLDRDAIFQIESIKARIESSAREHGRRHVKLSEGGIREIEFIVQIMQLANGGRCPDVRTPSTLEAIAALEKNHYMLDADRDELVESYLFLRRLEHRLQMLDGRQTHLLPEDTDEIDTLARTLDYRNGEDLWRDYMEKTTAVRRFYERRFSRSKEISVTPVELSVMTILDEAAEPAAQARALADLGLDAESVPELRQLSQGSAADPPASSVRRLFVHGAAVWMPMLRALPAPAEALRRLARMVQAYGAKASLYDIFASHPPVAELLTNIAALSEPLSDRIVRDPSSFEALLAPGGVTGSRTREELVARLADFHATAPSSRRARLILSAEEHMRIGVRFLMGLADAHETSRSLTTLAELLIGETEFAVVAFGRMAARLMGWTSDCDLVFVSDRDSHAAAAEVKKSLDDWAAVGLKVDARLRPMGRTSPIVTQIDALEEYLKTEARTWERVAWARSRVIAGPPPLARKIEAMRDAFLFGPFGAKQWTEIVSMRRKILDEGVSAQGMSDADLKRGRGGMIDIDFIVAREKMLRRTGGMDPADLLAGQPELLAASRFLHTLDSAVQITLGRRYRGDESEFERARVGTVMQRHGLDPADLPAHRAVIGAAFDAVGGEKARKKKT